MPKIKGTHTAMKTGMLAGEEVFAALTDTANGISVGEWYEGETLDGEPVETDPAFDLEVTPPCRTPLPVPPRASRLPLHRWTHTTKRCPARG